MKVKPHWKTKVWITLPNGEKAFYYLEEDIDRKNFNKK